MNQNVTHFFFLALIYFAQFMQYAILARVIVSWIRLSRENVLVNLLFVITEPILGPIREMLNKSPFGKSGMPVDFSPILAFFLIRVVIILLDGAMKSMGT
jgi:YggT family protein